MSIIRINFDWLNSIQMSATPGPSAVLGSKRTIEEVLTDEETNRRKNMMAILALNSSLEKLKFSITTQLKLKINEERNTQTKHEFVLLDVLSDPDARYMLLYLMSNECFVELCKKHGINMASRNRGDSTRAVIDFCMCY
jgi:hypothetical protein